MKNASPLQAAKNFDDVTLLTTPEQLMAYRREVATKKPFCSIGFVPTMGALHEGHSSLIEKSVAQNDLTVVSIFINPTQFNNAQDLENYPQTFEKDLAWVQSCKADAIFMPSSKDMYPDGYIIKVSADCEMSNTLEGEMRPGHFTGALSIILRLFNLVRPNKVYFGEKDYQQLELVKLMVKNLFLPIEVVPCPTFREKSGLAMSSRNARLSDESKAHSAKIYYGLKSFKSVEDAKSYLENEGFAVEYLVDVNDRRLTAVQIDGVRLIDNVSLVDS